MYIDRLGHVMLRLLTVFFWLMLTLSSWSVSGNRAAAQKSERKQPPTDNLRTDAAEPDDQAESDRLLDQFQQTYALPDDQVIKRVAPPFTPGRMEYYRVYHEKQARILPEGPEYMWFWWDRRRPSRPPLGRPARRSGRINSAGIGWVGGEGLPVSHLVSTFTDIRSHEMAGDRELKWTHISGDWIVRDGVPREQMLTGLETVLRRDCQLPLKFELGEQQRQLVVVTGKYAYQPLPGRGTVTEDRKYAYEGSDLQDYDQLDIFEQDRTNLKDVKSGTLDQLLDSLTRLLDCPVLNEGVALPDDMVNRQADQREHLLLWRSERLVPWLRKVEDGSLDTAAVLRNLRAQTGLDFSLEWRQTFVLLIKRTKD